MDGSLRKRLDAAREARRRALAAEVRNGTAALGPIPPWVGATARTAGTDEPGTDEPGTDGPGTGGAEGAGNAERAEGPVDGGRPPARLDLRTLRAVREAAARARSARPDRADDDGTVAPTVSGAGLIGEVVLDGGVVLDGEVAPSGERTPDDDGPRPQVIDLTSRRPLRPAPDAVPDGDDGPTSSWPAWGPADAPPPVLLHSAPGATRAWTPGAPGPAGGSTGVPGEPVRAADPLQQRCPYCSGKVRLDMFDLVESVAHLTCLDCGVIYTARSPRS